MTNEEWIAFLEKEITEFTHHAEELESGRAWMGIRGENGEEIDVTAERAASYRTNIATHQALIERVKAKI